MRVAAYIRVSTDEQAEKGNSLNEQKERLEAYCKVMNWESPTFFVDDGYSAGDLKRPNIKLLFKQIEQRKFDVLITTKLDRLSRNLLDLMNTINLLTQYDCSYVSATESFDTSTAAGRMVLQLLGVFAEFERGRISERVKDNMLSLAKKSNKALSKACFGYDIIDGQYVINEEEAKYVREMFDLAENGKGSRSIAKIMNDKGVLTKRRKLWDSTNVTRLITNEILAGIRIYNKRGFKNGKQYIRPKEEWIISENNHPAIIDPDRFYKVQDIINNRKRVRKHAENETYILSGILKCGYCGGTMKGSTSRAYRGERKYLYYRYICSSYQLNYGCKHHAIHRDVLEKQVIEMIKEVAETSNANLTIKVSSKSNQEEIKEIEQQIERLNNQMQRQIEAHGKGIIEEEDLMIASQRVKEERNLLRAKLAMLKEKKGDIQKVHENAKKLIDDIEGIDRLKAKAGIMKLIESMVIKDEEIDVYWRS